MKVLFIVAKNGFRDAEFLEPAEILRKAGREVFVASNARPGESAVGADGAEVKVDFDYRQADISGFDLLVFVGGPGALENLDNEASYELIKKWKELKRPLAAICVAPVILAKAGVLAGRRATVWRTSFDREPVEILRSRGAVFVGESVVEDGDLVTADGPKAAGEFGLALERLLKQTEKTG